MEDLMFFFVVVIGVLSLGTEPANLFRLEAEEFAKDGNMTMIRSNASGERSVLLFQGEHIELEFCISETGVVEISDIYYSNDGQSDDIAVGIDGHMTGHFTTMTELKSGRGWNNVLLTGNVGVSRKLFPGHHVVNVLVLYSDTFGVELDAVVLKLTNSKSGSKAFNCSVFCFSDIEYRGTKRRSTIPVATFVQKSNTTICAEQRNVQVEIFHKTATTFRLRAVHPQYPSFSSNTNPDYTSCGTSDVIWEFQDIDASSVQKIESSKTNVTINKTSIGIRMNITFGLENASRYGGTDIPSAGSTLTLKLGNSNKRISMSLQYMTRAMNWTGPEKRFTLNGSELVWEFPNNAWTNDGENKISLKWLSSPLRKTFIQNLKLKVRPDQRDRAVIFSDKTTLVEGVVYNRQIHAMTIERSDNNESFSNIDCLYVTVKEPWGEIFSTIFSLCQDGRIQLAPIARHGSEKIPFTSSFLLGAIESRNTHMTGSAIRRVVLYMSSMSLSIEFSNNASFFMILNYTKDETALVIKDCSIVVNRTVLPVMTYESMWVENGNADVDHVTIDGGQPHHIMTPWGELHGLTAVLFRRCISRHNTLGPDIKVDVLKEADTCNNIY